MTTLQEAAQYRSLYELTGDIKDLNTMLVPRTALAQHREQQGWKRVPVEPTPEMLKAPPNAWEADAKITYAAMLAAAPPPQAQQGEQQPVCHGCGIPAGDVHMSTCKSGKWPSRVSNGDTAAPAPQPVHQGERAELIRRLLAIANTEANEVADALNEAADMLQSAQPEDGCAPNHMCYSHRVYIPTGECCNKCGATSW